ncbi:MULTISPECIES: hypothetical protein [unclassified Streptomyces]|uniref:hypothetical protein n=1 Tax=unclassified Streptomyces TaxID=2593676 RepID=UPI00109E8D53|nr:hypothetical protein [Streptomyces sp. A1136]THA57538.1 hypothetical protein E6R62_06660 [Streptomyces sp. A1136]
MSGTARTGGTDGGGGMEDKAQRPGIGREEQVDEAPGQEGGTRGRSKEESTRRRPGEGHSPRDGRTEEGGEGRGADGP